MSKMISVASGFQYSVNIGYDLNNDDKLKNFIPTRSALALMEDILLSTNPTSTERARVLIGAYGKGKSHIVLTILAMLMKRNSVLFEKANPKIDENPRLCQIVDNYYESNNKILPVIITGSNTSLPQAFLLALQRTLSTNGLLDVMPETNYKAAVQVINRWEKEFPDTYKKLKEALDMPIKQFVEELQSFGTEAYEKFEKIYPTLTAGSVFNPFLGFDVVDLYEEAVKGLKSKGYTGIYVIYDEFSKFLEANIKEASVSDTKMLQDFAEKCNRSGEAQMHLMLISHKEIANYIDKLPKQKVDGWRGVSERFKHIHLNNNFTQTYEIIGSAIQKKSSSWNKFCKEYAKSFEDIFQRYGKHHIFSDVDEEYVEKTMYGCYPLHPVSTFILPRLSERVAQNERTLFTFISAPGVSTLLAFLENYEDDHFELITPDLIYDYFEPLFKKEVYGGSIHENYVLTEMILEKLGENFLESKIIKTLALIYILEQFEKLQPSKDELVSIYSISYTPEEINQAIDNLIEKEYVIYLKRSNNYLRLKQTSGVDIRQKINDMVEVQSKRTTVKDTLNNSNFDNYVYPSRYNNERDMIRYFTFEFIDEDEVTEDVDWTLKSASIDADGVIYGIIPHSEESISRLKEIILNTSTESESIIFILPRHFAEINDIVKEFNAVSVLRDNANDDKVLFDEYEVIYEDLREVIGTFMRGYTRPEEYKSRYIYKGREVAISRKAALTELMSTICDEVYSLTPVINNEAMNRNEITATANNSRNKIVAALLRNELEPNLGLTGSGQEVSIMRGTLIRTGVWEENDGLPKLNLKPTAVEHMDEMLAVIEDFIVETRQNGTMSFEELYRRLTSAECHIGLRKGLIPIYLAAVMHEYKREVIISDQFGQVTLSAETLLQINSKPEMFTLAYLDWDPEKEGFVNKLAESFAEYIVDAERGINSYDYAVSAMRRWYMALPKYAKESKKGADGKKIPKAYQELLKLLKQNISGNELLFEKMPKLFAMNEFQETLSDNVGAVKKFYDEYLKNIKKSLIKETKELFALPRTRECVNKMSLSSVIKDWCESLDQTVFEQLFTDGTEKCLGLFRSITNDDDLTITRLAKLATDLRIEDWDEKVADLYTESIRRYKETAEAHHSEKRDTSESQNTSTYQITFLDDNGVAVTKRFNSVEGTGKGKLLHNQVTAALESMGRAISDQEKRQILMEILKDLC
ncbi:restriction endonuclease subunit S [Roseburia hominis]